MSAILYSKFRFSQILWVLTIILINLPVKLSTNDDCHFNKFTQIQQEKYSYTCSQFNNNNFANALFMTVTNCATAH